MQNLVVGSCTVCMHVGGPKFFFGLWGPTPCDGDVIDSLETRSYISYVTLPNLVTLGQTI